LAGLGVVKVKRRLVIALFGGGVVGWPLAGLAQQKPMAVIGYIGGGSPGPVEPLLAAFRAGLRETGYVEGKNLAIEYRWAEGRYDRLPALAVDLVRRKVDVIATGNTTSALAAKDATSTIPIVFISGPDPVGDGLVASLARPGGKITGVSILGTELTPKRVELASELVSQASVIRLLINPNNASGGRIIREVQEAARAKGLQLNILKASTETEIKGAFAALGQGQVGALVVGADPFFYSLRDQIVALASRYAVPAIYPWPEFASAGGLIGYGASYAAAIRQTGIYVGRILKGENPADLPVQQPTIFELIINLTTAKALGLTVPQSLLARADEVIE
jgi:putative ABC transport system substrate-binding protein